MDERQKLMHRVQICDFVLVEVSLYLDTHPEDSFALEYFSKYQKMRQQAAEEFTKKFGPLVMSDYDGGPRWNWVDNPWPWDLEKED